MKNDFNKWDYIHMAEKILTSDAEFRIYLALLDFRNAEKGYAYPSLDVLAKKCHKNRTTISTILTRLKNKGLIRVEKGHSGKCNQYYFNWIDVNDKEEEFDVFSLFEWEYL